MGEIIDVYSIIDKTRVTLMIIICYNTSKTDEMTAGRAVLYSNVTVEKEFKTIEIKAYSDGKEYPSRNSKLEIIGKIVYLFVYIIKSSLTVRYGSF